ncbi:MAG: ABC transporter ATP-binding protein/permease, partial [Desulfobulbaceae bacterium]|nr:ABC transporter ATP-binding protein/permease [Desulfobulbaceae bacterium]
MNNDLQACMAILCPRYRGMLAILLVIGSCAGGIVYLENSLLQALVQEISLESDCQRSPIAVLLLRLVGPSTVPFLFLAAIFFAALVRALLSEKKTVLSLGMFARSRDDLEKVILSQLMHGDDDFYSNHSLAEIINRLEVDVTRVVDRRLTLVDCWWALAMVASNMLFFVLTDWRMAIVVAILCITGALYTHQVSKPIQQADKEYFYSNDQVKKDFEDYLQAVPEIQVGALFDSILSRFDFPQQKRLKAFMDWIIANARVLFAQIIWPVTALLLSVLIIFLGRHLQILAYSSNVSVVPVLIFALPTLFDNLTKLFALRIGYQLAANSMKRLQEYELRQERQWRAGGVIFDYCEGEADVAIEVEAATFQYRTKGGERHGGVSEVTASFRAGSWTAVVGAAGSGKSTMINMLLGRQPAQSGIVRYRMGRRDVPAEGNVLASFCTLMPQKPVIFDATIRENLLLGRRTPLAPHHFTAREMEHLEKIGLAAICRQKAMEMRPLATGRQLGEEWLAVLRQKARQAATELRVALMPFEGGGVDPAAPAWDAMLGGRTDAEAVIGLLLGRECSGLVRKLAASGLAPPLIERGRLVIDRSRNLLQLDSYSDFCDLAHHKLYRQVWELRRRCLAGQMASPSSQGEQLFFLVGLTSMPKEWSDCAADICNLFEELRKFGGEIEQLRKLVRPHWQDFDCREIHPYLCWRDNLLFGAALFANHRLRREMDARITDLLAQGPWGDFFVEQGMEFEAGHNGSRFSGGQRQLIALGRAL